jgi:hypothetical protein
MPVPQANLTFPEGHKIKSSSFPTGVFINNEFHESVSKTTIPVTDPTSEKIICQGELLRSLRTTPTPN